MKRHIGIIIVDYHSEVETRECLKSLEQAELMDQAKIFIVMPSATPLRIPKYPLSPVLLPQTENKGYAWAINLGCQEAIKNECREIVILNNDTIVDRHFLPPLIKQLHQPQVGLVSPKIYFYPDCEYHHDEYTFKERGNVIWYAGGVIDWKNVMAWHWGVNEVDHGQFENTVPSNFATGCCVAFNASLLESIGNWDERYFLYFEDTDWSVRAIRKNLKVVMEPSSKIWHKNAGSTGGPGSKIHVYYQTRNRILFAFKFASLRTKLAIFRQALFMAFNKSTGITKKAATDGLLNHYGKQL